MSFASVKAILDAHNYAALIGLDEDTWLEAKGKNPYDFNTPYGHYELAKDVSAFANADGGILIVGLTTTRLPESKIERISAHDLCTQAEFPIEQYRGLIRTHIHPSIKGLLVHWLPVTPDGINGLGVIEVPAQSQNQKYFLNAKVVDSGTRVKQIVFGGDLHPQRFFLAQTEPQKEITVWLHGAGEPIDVTRRHCQACALPFLVCIGFRHGEEPTTTQLPNLALRFRERDGEQRLLGEIDLLWDRTLENSESKFYLFRSKRAVNHCLPTIKFWLHTLRHAHYEWKHGRRGALGIGLGGVVLAGLLQIGLRQFYGL